MREIKTETVYSKEQIKKFLTVFYFDRIKYPRIIINILILVMIIYFFRKTEVNISDIIAFIIALFGIVELNTNMLPNINFNRMLKNKDNSPIDKKILYIFRKDDFKLQSDKIETIKYSQLKKVIETDIAYYLYINNSKAFIVDKTVLNEKDVESITTILKTNVSTYKLKK